MIFSHKWSVDQKGIEFKGSILSQSARFVHLCLCKHGDNTNQTCFPSLNRIAQIVGKHQIYIK
ncbi:helix-turn-helix domain-containing protein [Ruminiclostridium papyrosolvens]|uniref:helix-turn-helix domain-containing protein n=1 Tax=Ruminiclostridium papyrosolvens TaxID=29362 RepID=UPI0030846B11